MDVITAVLLTIAFVLTLHRGNKRVVNNNNAILDVEVNPKESELINRINNINDVKVENYEDLNNALNDSPVESANLNQVNSEVEPANLNDQLIKWLNSVAVEEQPQVNDVPVNNIPAPVATNEAENLADIPVGMDTSPVGLWLFSIIQPLKMLKHQ